MPSFLVRTQEQRAEESWRAHRLSIGAAIFKQWYRHAPDQRLHYSDAYWIERFHAVGPFRASVEGAIDAYMRVTRQELTDFELVEEAVPPPRLFRAATEAEAWGWEWCESFKHALGAANMHGSGARIWACDPAEVFGFYDVARAEPSGHEGAPDFIGTWRTWIVKPERVWEVPRWQDPYAPIPTDPTWAGRGVSQGEADSIVRAWAEFNDLGRAPLARESDAFWLDSFDRIGQFIAVEEGPEARGSEYLVTPAVSLEPPPNLYRGSTEALSTRWSWTDDLGVAGVYAKTFGNGSPVWACRPRRVLGRISVMGAEGPSGLRVPAHDEWVVIPDEVWLASRPQDDPRKRGELPADFWN